MLKSASIPSAQEEHDAADAVHTAASVISMPHSALYITFFPTISAELIPLPTPCTLPRAVFVCSNVLVVSDKVVGAKIHYNLRVIETLVSVWVLALRLCLTLAPSDRQTFHEVLGRWLEVPEEKGEPTLIDPDMLCLGLERILVETEELRLSDVVDGQEGMTMAEMVQWSGLTEVQSTSCISPGLTLYKCVKHVFSEALHVLQFRDVCLHAEDTKGALPERTLAELGAGWGGCMVSLVTEDMVDVSSPVRLLHFKHKRQHFVVTLGGDGTVLFTSWLFQRIVPPVLPFALGSLGFLTNFDFADHQVVENLLKHRLEKPLRNVEDDEEEDEVSDEEEEKYDIDDLLLNKSTSTAAESTKVSPIEAEMKVMVEDGQPVHADHARVQAVALGPVLGPGHPRPLRGAAPAPAEAVPAPCAIRAAVGLVIVVLTDRAAQDTAWGPQVERHPLAMLGALEHMRVDPARPRRGGRELEDADADRAAPPNESTSTAAESTKVSPVETEMKVMAETGAPI
ncbi:NAD(+) kinase [Grifola frondosa]|uniref:NAD(+) kinase n=1 Tax=Grifola frondosa TaxID=5627 RepID=A0A1C7LUK4_GRIFR|nr:NAD(+) kinase [Grifola frondosa]